MRYPILQHIARYLCDTPGKQARTHFAILSLKVSRDMNSIATGPLRAPAAPGPEEQDSQHKLNQPRWSSLENCHCDLRIFSPKTCSGCRTSHEVSEYGFVYGSKLSGAPKGVVLIRGFFSKITSRGFVVSMVLMVSSNYWIFFATKKGPFSKCGSRGFGGSRGFHSEKRTTFSLNNALPAL